MPSKVSQKFLSPIFMKITTFPNFEMENAKIENVSPYFFTFIFIFASISQKCPKKWSKTFSPIFMKITTYPNFNMENSKIKLIFPNFFTFIFALISQKCLTKWVKNFFLRCSWKLPHNLILIWRIQKLKSFSHIFSSSFSFFPRLVKNILKNESRFFFSDFQENCHIT